MSNRIYIPPRKDPRLPLVQPGGVIRPKGAGGAGPSEPYVQNRVDNNGTGTLNATNTLALGSPASPEFTLCLWMKTAASTTDWITRIGVGNAHGEQRIALQYAANNSNSSLKIQLGGTSTTNICDGTTSDLVARTQWQSALISRSGSTIKIAMNDAVTGFSVTPAASDQPFNTMDYVGICFGQFGSVPIDIELADYWFLAGTFIDFDIEANRRLFIDSNGDPVSLGADGSAPTGGQPDIFLGGPMLAADWNLGTNLGTAGPLVHSGAGFTDV